MCKLNKHCAPQVGLGRGFVIATESQQGPKPADWLQVTAACQLWCHPPGCPGYLGKCVNSGRAGPRRACLTVVTHGPHPLPVHQNLQSWNARAGLGCGSETENLFDMGQTLSLISAQSEKEPGHPRTAVSPPCPRPC